AIDAGVQVIVLLAGTRIALWRQTYDRILLALDGWSAGSDFARSAERILLPNPSILGQERTLPSLGELYSVHKNLARRRIQEGKPIIAVVMKQTDHLLRSGAVLQEICAAGIAASRGKPIHMVVMDDEADDGSILDAEAEADDEAPLRALKH